MLFHRGSLLNSLTRSSNLSSNPVSVVMVSTGCESPFGWWMRPDALEVKKFLFEFC